MCFEVAFMRIFDQNETAIEGRLLYLFSSFCQASANCALQLSCRMEKHSQLEYQMAWRLFRWMRIKYQYNNMWQVLSAVSKLAKLFNTNADQWALLQCINNCTAVRKESKTLRKVVFDSYSHTDPHLSNLTKLRAALFSVFSYIWRSSSESFIPSSSAMRRHQVVSCGHCKNGLFLCSKQMHAERRGSEQLPLAGFIFNHVRDSGSGRGSPH